jgi:hypothetical protein
MMYDADADKSVHTVHEKAGKPSTYKGSAGAPQIQLGRPKDVEHSNDDDSVSDVSNYSTWSKGDLIELCKKLQLDRSGTKLKGSQPKSSAKESATTPVRGDAKSLDSSSQSSSSSSSSEEESEGGASASSVEESQDKSSPARGE